MYLEIQAGSKAINSFLKGVFFLRLPKMWVKSLRCISSVFRQAVDAAVSGQRPKGSCPCISNGVRGPGSPSRGHTSMVCIKVRAPNALLFNPTEEK